MNKQLSEKKIVILDGTRSVDKHLDPVLTLLTDVLQQHESQKVQIFRLRNIRINHCIGCFDCWLKTPGRCIHNDAGVNILQEILNSNTVFFFTPVVFGGYSSELKKILDRFPPIVLPFFKKFHGETHHPLRYPNILRIIGIGVHPNPQKELSDCFKLLVGRNALNLPSSRYSAEVVSSINPPAMLRNQFHALLSRTDELPLHKELSSIIKNTVPVPKISAGNRRVLLIMGSPKIKSPSTSAVLGETLLERLKKHGWRTESLALKGSLLHDVEQCNLCSAVDKAGTIVLAFPLYGDTLPCLLIKALELIALHRKSVKKGQTKNLLAIINNGLPESHHNMLALDICQNFANECAMIWAGGLAFPAGETLISGQSLTGYRGFKGVIRPPLYHVVKALNITAASLAKGYPIPEKAVQLIAKKPIPIISFDLWRWIYRKIAKRILEKEASKNGLDRNTMLDRPYKYR